MGRYQSRIFQMPFRTFWLVTAFFILRKFNKILLEKHPITFLKPLSGIFREYMKNFDFMRSATNFHFRSVLVDILS